MSKNKINFITYQYLIFKLLVVFNFFSNISTSLVYFSSKDKWFGGATYAVMGLLVTSSIIVWTISFAKFIDGILNYIKNKKKIKNNVTPVDLKNKQNTKINSIISQTNFNENSQIDHSQQRINFDRPKYVSTEIISNHMIEEVKGIFTIIYYISWNKTAAIYQTKKLQWSIRH